MYAQKVARKPLGSRKVPSVFASSSGSVRVSSPSQKRVAAASDGNMMNKYAGSPSLLEATDRNHCRRAYIALEYLAKELHCPSLISLRVH